MAGINAHLKNTNQKPFILKRSDAYIGVLIDDLISKGTQEPYRMFTSRAEFRTLLRQDNADWRLTETSYRMGLASQERMEKLLSGKKEVEELKSLFKEMFIEPEEFNTAFSEKNEAPISEKQKVERLILRPGLSITDLQNEIPKVNGATEHYSKESLEQAEIQIKYQVYIDKEKEMVNKMKLLEDLEIPEQFDYQRIISLGAEAREKLKKAKPRTLGQASRISGINPTDVQILLIYMGR
jgi:tRNA uridine 5-carboxymethylaminomethyl modification enzyme